MTAPARAAASAQGGFSLIEVLVAFVIMAMALVVLDQAIGGSTRGVAEAERHATASLLAQSLLARYSSLPPGGIREQGRETNGLEWTLESRPYRHDIADAPWNLQQISAVVHWVDRRQERRLQLTSLLPELEEPRR
jgi:general secretion pathway protein I